MDADSRNSQEDIQSILISGSSGGAANDDRRLLPRTLGRDGRSRHPLAVLARRLPWMQIEASLAPLFARKARKGKSRDDADLFGPTPVVAAGGVSRAGPACHPFDGRAAVLQACLLRERRAPGRALERERGLAALQRHGVLPEQVTWPVAPRHGRPGRKLASVTVHAKR